MIDGLAMVVTMASILFVLLTIASTFVVAAALVDGNKMMAVLIAYMCCNIALFYSWADSIISTSRLRAEIIKSGYAVEVDSATVTTKILKWKEVGK